MAATNRAYETLISPQRRLTYDRTGEDRPPQVDNAAQQFIMGVVLEWMGSEPNSGDLIADVSARLDSEDFQVRQQIEAGTQYLERLRKRLKKIKFKGKGSDFLRHAVGLKITETRQKIEKCRDQQKMFAQARKVLAAYEYEVEPALVQTWTFSIR